ncbi:MAG: hypothetical protein ACUVUC_16665 [Thermoguttaceae bacterium]
MGALIERLRLRKPELLALVPEGWPADVAMPPWWIELASGFPWGFFTAARKRLGGLLGYYEHKAV